MSTTTTSSPSRPRSSFAHGDARDLVRAARLRRYRRGRARQVSLILMDVLALAIPLYGIFLTTSLLGERATVLMLLGAVGIWGVTFHLYGLYPRFPRHVATSTLNEVPRIFHASLLAALVSCAWLAAWGVHGGARAMAVVTVAFLLLDPLLRRAKRRLLPRLLGPERVLLVGSGSSTARVERGLQSRDDIVVVGHLPLPARWRRGSATESVVAEALEETVVREQIDRVLLSTAEVGDAAVGDLLQWSRSADVSLTVLPEQFDLIGVGAAIDHVQGATVLSLQPPALSRTARLLKRTMDVLGSAAGLVALTPVLLAVAVAVRRDSAGPILFRQERVGRGGRAFELLKFRTMVPDADRLVEELMDRSSDPHWLQLDDDPRITRVGRFLRATSLDELPQLWNVLVGHMSLVGPRPLSVRDDARVGGWARGRLDLTPGLTGLWQVTGRKAVPFEDMVKLDYVYVSNWSLWQDVKLLLQTLPAVLGGRGAR
ncbi:sugar transferase [Patulibacter sp. S7RM1-6]